MSSLKSGVNPASGFTSGLLTLGQPVRRKVALSQLSFSSSDPRPVDLAEGSAPMGLYRHHLENRNKATGSSQEKFRYLPAAAKHTALTSLSATFIQQLRSGQKKLLLKSKSSHQKKKKIFFKAKQLHLVMVRIGNVPPGERSLSGLQGEDQKTL